MNKGTKLLQNLLDKITNMTPEEFVEHYNSGRKKVLAHKVIVEEMSLEHMNEPYCSYCFGYIEKELIRDAQDRKLDFIRCPYCFLSLSLVDIKSKI